MGDTEWERWQSSWKTENRPMPEVLRRAKSDRLRAIVGTVIFCAILLVEIAVAVTGLRGDASPGGVAAAVLILASSAGLGVGFFVAMRGSWAKSSGSPLELLAGLERRHLARRRLMLVVLVCTAVIVTGVLALAVLSMVRHGSAMELVGPVGASLFTVAFTWLVTSRVSRVIDRELAQVKEARALMGPAEATPHE